MEMRGAETGLDRSIGGGLDVLGGRVLVREAGNRFGASLRMRGARPSRRNIRFVVEAATGSTLISATLRRHASVLEGSNGSGTTKTSQESLLTRIRVGPLEFVGGADVGRQGAVGVELGLDDLVAGHGGDLALIGFIDNVLLGQRILLLAAPLVSYRSLLLLTSSASTGPNYFVLLLNLFCNLLVHLRVG